MCYKIESLLINRFKNLIIKSLRFKLKVMHFAGILPATMAMMIPMILGRRKRDLTTSGLGFLDHETMIKKLIPGNKVLDNS